MPTFIDITGMRFGRLFVIGRYETTSNRAYWLCDCDCGNTIVARGTHLRRGHTQSCGCLHDEMSSERIAIRNYRHGRSDTRLYHIWVDMKKRCTNPHHWAYARYGGRGITFTQAWDQFEMFERWSLENGYEEHLTLDRLDNDGHYSPGNCRWATRKTQARNKSNNTKYAYANESLTLAEWAERTGMRYTTLYGRVHNYGWSIEQALNTPVRRHKQYASP